MEIQNPTRFIRAATHRRGMYEISTAFELLGAVSRKVRPSAGTFDIDLPLTGPAGVEDRTGPVAGAYSLVLHFTNPVTAGTANVTGHNPGGTGTVSSVSFSGNGHDHQSHWCQ